MTYARKNLVSLSDTPYYHPKLLHAFRVFPPSMASHIVARCVRRAWLWGFDEYAGRDYSHRKDWVLERLSQLTSIFTIEICAFAVMSNHYHLVVFVYQDRPKSLSREEVYERWTQLFRAPPVVERWRTGAALEAERRMAECIVEKWRPRLCDLSDLLSAVRMREDGTCTTSATTTNRSSQPDDLASRCVKTRNLSGVWCSRWAEAWPSQFCLPGG